MPLKKSCKCTICLNTSFYFKQQYVVIPASEDKPSTLIPRQLCCEVIYPRIPPKSVPYVI